MNNALTFAVLMGFLSCNLSACSGTSRPASGEDSGLREFVFTTIYSPRFSVQHYALKYDQDGQLLLERADRGPAVTIYRVPDEVAARVDEMVRTYKLKKLKHSYKPLVRVLDGKSWTFKVKYKDASIYSGGENAWPSSKLMDGINAIRAYLDEVIAGCSEEDIIGQRDYLDR